MGIGSKWHSVGIFCLISIFSKVGKSEWFEMTCAGHDPGEGRPGVLYDMSRCCFFRSGNILADGTQEDVNSSTRLQRLKRSFECREQIGKFKIILLYF